MILENTDDQEAYWFVRWCQIRVSYRKAQKALKEIEDSDIFILRQENLQLKNALQQIRKDFVPEPKPKKRSYKGNNPNKYLKP